MLSMYTYHLYEYADAPPSYRTHATLTDLVFSLRSHAKTCLRARDIAVLTRCASPMTSTLCKAARRSSRLLPFTPHISETQPSPRSCKPTRTAECSLSTTTPSTVNLGRHQSPKRWTSARQQSLLYGPRISQDDDTVESILAFAEDLQECGQAWGTTPAIRYIMHNSERNIA